MEQINIKWIVPDPTQPRQSFDPKSMELLEKSIKDKGILVPLMVEKTADNKFLVVDGERRYRAATKLGIKTVPVEITQPMTTTERMIMRFHLQDQHASWTPFDRARAVVFFKDQGNLTNYETAELLGMTVQTVENWVGILKLSKRSQDLAINKRLPFSYLNRLAKVVNKYEQITDMPTEEIEKKLIKKLDNHEIANIKEFQFVANLLIKEEKSATMMKFLNTGMNVKVLLGVSDKGGNVKLDNLSYQAQSMINNLKLCKKDKKDLEQKHIDKLLALRNEIKDFIA